MRTPLRFHQSYPGGRILLMLGAHETGAVFPPVGSPQDRLPWVWRFWLGSPSAIGPNGRAKTELAARNALLTEARNWLQKAGIDTSITKGETDQ